MCFLKQYTHASLPKWQNLSFLCWLPPAGPTNTSPVSKRELEPPITSGAWQGGHTAQACISSPQKEGLGIENGGNEQSSCSPGQLQLPGVTSCWEHQGSSTAQHKLPALPVTGMLHMASLPHQSLQLPHTPSGGSRRHGLHWQILNLHPGCSTTTSGRNPATSSASQTFSLAWQSPELGKLAPVPGPHKHDFSTEIKPVTAKGQTQALQILSTPQPHTLAAWAQLEPLPNLWKSVFYLEAPGKHPQHPLICDVLSTQVRKAFVLIWEVGKSSWQLKEGCAQTE